jgi:hypothetical protein
MSADYRVVVFGRLASDKSQLLNRRVDKILSKDEWSDFEKVYMDMETEDGLVAFCRAECINPQRIPALIVMRKEADGYAPVPNPSMGREDPLCQGSKLHHWLGLQTDYSSTGSGMITPKMIASVLQEARG